MNWRRGLKRVAIVIFIIWQMIVAPAWFKIIHNYFDRFVIPNQTLACLDFYPKSGLSPEKLAQMDKVSGLPPASKPYQPDYLGICWQPREFFVWAILTPLVICAIFYILGWIIRGFKETKNDD